MSLYTEVRDSGGYLDHHYSDLYIEVTPENSLLIAKHGRRATTFVNQVTGKLCYDIPFAYDPYWEHAKAEAERQLRISHR